MKIRFFLQKLVLFFVTISLSVSENLFAAPQDHQPLVILVNQKAGEKEHPEYDSIAGVTSTFIHTISLLKDGAIIISNSLLYNFVKRKHSTYSKEELNKHYENEELKDVSFERKDWRLYKVKGTQFFLVMPQSKFNKIKKKLAGEDFENITELLTGDKEGYAKLADSLDNDKDKDLEVTSAHLEKIIEAFPKIFSPKLVFDIFLNGHGNIGETIANLSPQEMQAFIRFCNINNSNENIKIGSMCISSCYVGGTNLDLIRFQDEVRGKSGKGIDINCLKELTYPLIAWGIQDSATYHVKFDIQGFFSNLANLDTGGKSTFEDVLRCLVTSSNGMDLLQENWVNIPQVLLPRGLDFQTLNIDKQIKIIGNVLVRVHQEENEPIILKDITVALVYPTVIPVSIKVESKNDTFPNVISMQRGEDATHFFKQINVNGKKTDRGVFLFVRDAFFNIDVRVTEKTFLIDALIGNNDLVDDNRLNMSDKQLGITRVIIKTKYEHFEISFEHNNKIYISTTEKPHEWDWKIHDDVKKYREEYQKFKNQTLLLAQRAKNRSYDFKDPIKEEALTREMLVKIRKLDTINTPLDMLYDAKKLSETKGYFPSLAELSKQGYIPLFQKNIFNAYVQLSSYLAMSIPKNINEDIIEGWKKRYCNDSVPKLDIAVSIINDILSEQKKEETDKKDEIEDTINSNIVLDFLKEDNTSYKLKKQPDGEVYRVFDSNDKSSLNVDYANGWLSAFLENELFANQSHNLFYNTQKKIFLIKELTSEINDLSPLLESMRLMNNENEQSELEKLLAEQYRDKGQLIFKLVLIEANIRYPGEFIIQFSLDDKTAWKLDSIKGFKKDHNAWQGYAFTEELFENTDLKAYQKKVLDYMKGEIFTKQKPISEVLKSTPSRQLLLQDQLAKIVKAKTVLQKELKNLDKKKDKERIKELLEKKQKMDKQECLLRELLGTLFKKSTDTKN